MRLVGSLPAERETEARHGSVGGVVHAGVILIAWLVVVMGGVVGVLIETPGFIVTLELHPLIDGKRWDADAREAEVIGAVVMSGFGARVRTNLKAEILSSRLHRGIKRGALGSGNLDFFGRAERPHVVIVEIERNLARRNRGMLTQIFGAQQALFFGGDRDEEDRTARLLLGVCVGASDFHQDAAAGCV